MMYVIRPYGEWIREHVFAILEQADINTGDPVTLEEIASQLRNHSPGFLLVPYHAKGGINGLTILLSLHKEGLIPDRLPIMMPISMYAAAGFELSRNKLDDADKKWLAANVCILYGPFENHPIRANELKKYLRSRF